MGRPLVCDICKKETLEIVGKLFYAPSNRVNGAKNFHNNYQLHLDVGVCCEAKLKNGFRWTQRVSAKTYHANRRKSAKPRG